MPNIDDTRSKFYDDSDPFALDSTTGGGSSSSNNGRRTIALLRFWPHPPPDPRPIQTAPPEAPRHRGTPEAKASIGRAAATRAAAAPSRDRTTTTPCSIMDAIVTMLGLDYGLGPRTQDIADVDTELGERARQGVVRREE